MTDGDGDLFDYDVGLDEILNDLPTAPPPDNAANTFKDVDASGDNATPVLGLDADLKATRQRAPVAKLDEARLLSQNGIPKLRKNARTKLRFKGKGHELSDLGRLLNFYQLWLDDLYPRAKFADGLEIIERLGHTRRVQIMRREWIDEDKPSQRDYTALAADAAQRTADSNDQGGERRGDTGDVPDENDDLHDLLAELGDPASAGAT